MVDERKVLDAAWRSFAERAIPPSAPLIQRQEMRRAFYAGAASLLDAMMRFLDPGDEPSQADLRRMDAIQAELEQFGKDVQEGRA